MSLKEAEDDHREDGDEDRDEVYGSYGRRTTEEEGEGNRFGFDSQKQIERERNRQAVCDKQKVKQRETELLVRTVVAKDEDDKMSEEEVTTTTATDYSLVSSTQNNGQIINPIPDLELDLEGAKLRHQNVTPSV